MRGSRSGSFQVHEALKREVEFRTSTEVVDLIIQDGKLAGVETPASDNSTRRIRAKRGVLLISADTFALQIVDREKVESCLAYILRVYTEYKL
jgi:phytoene dehydrogenase-like protein